jgi:hypothetical protein
MGVSAPHTINDLQVPAVFGSFASLGVRKVKQQSVVFRRGNAIPYQGSPAGHPCPVALVDPHTYNKPQIGAALGNTSQATRIADKIQSARKNNIFRSFKDLNDAVSEIGQFLCSSSISSYSCKLQPKTKKLNSTRMTQATQTKRVKRLIICHQN